MPIEQNLAVRDAHDAEARFIGMTAVMRCYFDHHTLDIDIVRQTIGELAGDDMPLIARSMYFAKAVGGRNL